MIALYLVNSIQNLYNHRGFFGGHEYYLKLDADFALNRAHRRKKQMKRDDILSILRTFKENAAAEYDIKRIGIFGSFARGEANKDSDVDIVFETDSPNLFRTARMKTDLERLLSRHVDVVRFRANMNPRLKSRIAREAQYV